MELIRKTHECRMWRACAVECVLMLVFANVDGALAWVLLAAMAATFGVQAASAIQFVMGGVSQ